MLITCIKTFIQKLPTWSGQVIFHISKPEVSGIIFVSLWIFSRKIISWNISSNPNTDLVIQTFQKAYYSRNCPDELMFHSDRGSQYTAFAFRKLLDERNVIQSFSKRHLLLITPAAKLTSNISKKKKPIGVIFVSIVTYTTLSSNISKASITFVDHMVL